ncbi:MAG: hypothetical protein ACI4PE_05090 [Bacilli bacterium]
MKKIYSGIILFITLILISNLALATEYWEKENQKIKTACEVVLDSYIKTFMTEETPEQDRIKDYTFTGYGMSEGEDENKLYMHISMNIIPVNEDNTTWSKHGDICFVVFSKVNDEYVVDRISRYPDNYDKFLERFEEYKKSDSETDKKETISIQGESQNNLASQEIQKINNGLVIGFGILFIISSISFIIFVRKKIIKNK